MRLKEKACFGGCCFPRTPSFFSYLLLFLAAAPGPRRKAAEQGSGKLLPTAKEGSGPAWGSAPSERQTAQGAAVGVSLQRAHNFFFDNKPNDTNARRGLPSRACVARLHARPAGVLGEASRRHRQSSHGARTDWPSQLTPAPALGPL